MKSFTDVGLFLRNNEWFTLCSLFRLDIERVKRGMGIHAEFVSKYARRI